MFKFDIYSRWSPWWAEEQVSYRFFAVLQLMIRFMLFLNILKTFRLQTTLLSIYENEKVIHSEVLIPFIKLAD